MEISDVGLKLIAAHEGFRAKAYVCPAGVITIGYGTTRIGGKAVKLGEVCTKEQAEYWLRADVAKFETAIEKLVKVPLTQGEFDALVSFVYNIGDGAFAKSTLLKKLNGGDKAGAASEFAKWNKGGGVVLKGLVIRRVAERARFLAK